MVFDYTKGKKVKYVVSFYSEYVEDKYYFANLKSAKAFFQKAITSKSDDTNVSLWDIEYTKKYLQKRKICGA